ncbi:DUF6183 family protein [Streptomyces sp. NPDC054841]
MRTGAGAPGAHASPWTGANAEGVERQARQSTWFRFEADAEWFHNDIAADYGIAALSPDRRRIAVLTATDSDWRYRRTSATRQVLGTGGDITHEHGRAVRLPNTTVLPLGGGIGGIGERGLGFAVLGPGCSSCGAVLNRGRA